ncbi:PH domain-containing protein [Candidatus Saccharibacteria bacterium]|nr:MAG: PH domain-containing protein [Candidatus Saccharibacteria bacterium]
MLMSAKATKQKSSKDTPEKYFDDQFDDEEVLFVFRKHPIVMRKGLILACLGPLIGVLPAAIQPTLGFGFFFGGLAAGFVLGFLFILPSWIAWYYSVFIVTDQRFIQITQKGLFTRSVVDLGLSKIQSTNYEVRGVQATLLGFGTIVIQTYMGDMVIHEVHHPAKVIRKLATILRDQGIIAEDIETGQLEPETGAEEE